ncbi:hypothetical protein GBAR_LOCUS3642, partial [Geodia barretti]
MYSGKVSQSQRIPWRMDSRGMASMRFIIRMFRSRSSGGWGRSQSRTGPQVRRKTELAGEGGVGVPVELSVIVGVQVHSAWGDDAA